MEITIFAKNRLTQDGKPFVTYLTKLPRKDGTEVTVQVKFRQTCAQPKSDSCPRNIVIKKFDASMSEREFINEETGESRISRTLWVGSWEDGTPYVDHSLDDFDID